MISSTFLPSTVLFAGAAAGAEVGAAAAGADVAATAAFVGSAGLAGAAVGAGAAPPHAAVTMSTPRTTRRTGNFLSISFLLFDFLLDLSVLCIPGRATNFVPQS